MVIEGKKIGNDCYICSHTLIEGDVIIGDRVTVKSGVQLRVGTRIEYDVFTAPNAIFTNNRSSESKEYPEQFIYRGGMRALDRLPEHSYLLPERYIFKHQLTQRLEQ